MPNPWDVGAAKVLTALGFEALATTSSGFAATLGRRDGSVSRGEALTHAAAIVGSTPVPVSADLENGFADEPEGVAATVRDAISTGLAGCSIEDWRDRIYDLSLATERIAAAAEAAHAHDTVFVLTARAENFIRGNPDLDDTIRRLQAYQAAGADVVYTPGVSALRDIRSIVESVDVPVNVLTVPNAPPIPELATVGVARVSVGGAFAYAAWGAVADAARELRGPGTYGFWDGAARGAEIARAAFSA